MVNDLWTFSIQEISRILYRDQTTKFVYEGRREPFGNLKDFQNVILDRWLMSTSDSQNKKNHIAVATVTKKKGGPIGLSAHFLMIS